MNHRLKAEKLVYLLNSVFFNYFHGLLDLLGNEQQRVDLQKEVIGWGLQVEAVQVHTISFSTVATGC